MHIRKAERKDLSRIAEIFVFNNRTNFFPIFKDPEFSFKELQVVPLVDHYFGKEEILNTIYVYDDGLIKGFIQISGLEICKLYMLPSSSCTLMLSSCALKFMRMVATYSVRSFFCSSFSAGVSPWLLDFLASSLILLIFS